VQKETALPVRRTVRFDVQLPQGSSKVALEVWEVKEGIRVEKVKPPKPEYSDGSEVDDDEEVEEIEVKHKTITKETLLGIVQFDAKLGVTAKGKTKDAGKTTTTLEVQFIVGIDADLKVSVNEFGKYSLSLSLRVMFQKLCEDLELPNTTLRKAAATCFSS